MEVVKAYRFDMTFGVGDSYTARCGVWSAESTRSLARQLVEAGMSDAPIEGGRPGHLDWRIASLHRHAASAVSAKEAASSRETLHPALLAAVDAMAAERARRAERLS